NAFGAHGALLANGRKHDGLPGSSLTERRGWVKKLRPGSEDALGGGDAGVARVGFHGLPQGASAGLENPFDDVVRVASVVTEDVQVHESVGRDSPREFLRKRGV